MISKKGVLKEESFNKFLLNNRIFDDFVLIKVLCGILNLISLIKKYC